MRFWKGKPAKASLSAGLFYLFWLLAFKAREWMAIGDPATGDTLTEIVTWISWEQPWFGAVIMAFLTWLWIHFARRIFPGFWKRR